MFLYSLRALQSLSRDKANDTKISHEIAPAIEITQYIKILTYVKFNFDASFELSYSFHTNLIWNKPKSFL